MNDPRGKRLGGERGATGEIGLGIRSENWRTFRGELDVHAVASMVRLVTKGPSMRRVILVMSLSGAIACGSGDAVSQETPSIDACGSIEESYRSCGLLTEGEFVCGDESPAKLDCIAKCIEGSDCVGRRKVVCLELLPTDPVFACLDECEPRRECMDGTEVYESFWCDGHDDCADGNDEEECEGLLFECSDGRNISTSLECNGTADCTDGDDELGCPPPPTFECDGNVFPEWYWCDGVMDCMDGSDEQDCPEPPQLASRICD